MTLDLSALWNFAQPEESEKRFRAALATASSDDAIILQTQIARSYSLRRDFAQAQAILAALAAQMEQASIEAQVHYQLELGRSYASATHPPETQTAETKELARSAYLRAVELAQLEKLDALAIDALHMLTCVDTSPEDQIAWNSKAIALMNSSTQPAAKGWAASLHNNLGYALHLAGRYDEAIIQFKLALAAHQLKGNPQSIRIAYWMIAWTLRPLGQLDEALEIQLRLERECDEAGEPDPYVFEELEQLYQTLNNPEQAAFYAARHKAAM